MAEILYLRCCGCGELHDGKRPYCDECNRDLAYRAMPFILGMLLAPAPLLASAPQHRSEIPAGRHLFGGYDDENSLAWE